MPSIDHFEVFAVDLPFRISFKHAAAERNTSDSVFLRCVLDDGSVGFGEALPRVYVTGESRDGAFDLLCTALLPRLVGARFAGLEEVHEFLRTCSGEAPSGWVDPPRPHTSAWSAVDLALLDAFGHAAGRPAFAAGRRWPETLRYSGALSSHRGWRLLRSALKQRVFGLRAVKLKVDRDTDAAVLRVARRGLGRACDLRVDANMAWDVDSAPAAMAMMARYGVRSFEQPLPADDLAGLARLVRETGLGVMADESLGNAASLRRLLEQRACTAVNVRISKCGGLVASAARCAEALAAGLVVQIGCQVGESSLLSAAHLALVSEVGAVRYAEGCFGLHLLAVDPAAPCLQFGRGGRPPPRPTGAGLGVGVDLDLLRRHSSGRQRIGKPR